MGDWVVWVIALRGSRNEHLHGARAALRLTKTRKLKAGFKSRVKEFNVFQLSLRVRVQLNP